MTLQSNKILTKYIYKKKHSLIGYQFQQSNTFLYQMQTEINAICSDILILKCIHILSHLLSSYTSHDLHSPTHPFDQSLTPLLHSLNPSYTSKLNTLSKIYKQTWICSYLIMKTVKLIHTWNLQLQLLCFSTDSSSIINATFLSSLAPSRISYDSGLDSKSTYLLFNVLKFNKLKKVRHDKI